MASSGDKILLQVTPAQKEAILELFQERNWELKELSNKGTMYSSEESGQSDGNGDIHSPEPMDAEGAGESDSQGNDDGDGFLIPQDPEEARCPHCLCQPCITNEVNRQFWWENQAQAAHLRNIRYRKIAYKKFWTMLYHRGVWLDPEYMRRKVIALGYDPNQTEYVYHRRDIMPNCVLQIVRGWYPNPSGVPYRGHLWGYY